MREILTGSLLSNTGCYIFKKYISPGSFLFFKFKNGEKNVHSSKNKKSKSMSKKKLSTQLELMQT
jgi:hypothetical protein